MGRNMLVDGEWKTDIEPHTDEDGAFDRVETSFRDWIRDESDARFQPEDDRYHLYIARNCPWAHGTALTLQLTGLTDAISIDIVDPWREDDGWKFTPEKNGCTPDTVSGCEYLREVYVNADPEFTGRVTVPVLWDKREETIVNNESIEIMRMFATEFDEYADGVDLYPEGYRDEIDRIIDDVYDSINNGVYRAGFADSQGAYDEAVRDVFDGLDHYDEVLADRRYLAGDRLTLADVRLFPTLIRFDAAYHTAFKCDKQYLHQYDNLWPYLRDLYQTPGVAETVVMDHIRDEGYFQGEITSIGPDLDFEAPHDRDRLPSREPDTRYEQ
ncbi:glutathione S-transferase family protein [Natrarchaeobius halalkaliphilus]|uniref:Glutathione S-transferase family protein n=1 Tax=Natrarchaeobius halalkaliphilus TaxID=1679091 RepID=A0A3N6P1Y8_9EURY|nr:glutathione S-transferase C-terminal domain-containing protein [Natrarchaeobius halalkaliphilus]RQG91569.1 glutathione S-transferase family protein [Natrarchaeobius halalkaliphilus]